MTDHVNMTVTTVGPSPWKKESARIAVGKMVYAVVVRAAYMRWILIRVILVIHLYFQKFNNLTFVHFECIEICEVISRSSLT